MKTPKFWYSQNSVISKILLPLSFLWILGGIIKNKKSYNIKNIKIIKIGNVVVGGSGKTPTVITIVKKLINSNKKVHIITKGYKGSIKKSVLVNTKIHSYKEVGDEAIILSKIAPTWIGKSRIQSINNAKDDGAEIVVLDDGIQDNTIKGDLNILVFNGSQGIGNGQIIPSGPLRENLEEALKKCNLSIMIEEDENDIKKLIKNYTPIIDAEINIESEYINNFKDKDVVAFCGLGYPEKFYKTLKKIGCNIIYKESFPDHHKYKEKIIKKLIKKANTLNSLLITTEKDHVKITNEYKSRIFYFPITTKYTNENILNNLLSSLLSKK